MSTNANDPRFTGREQTRSASSQTVDLQGVAAFASLVELIAQELGTTAGRIRGLLPSGPAAFEEVAGEIVLNGQGFQRTLTLLVNPGSPLKMRFQCAWRDGQKGGSANASISGIEAHFFMDATVEQIMPQGRALARHIEDTFAVLDRMVTLGQSSKLSAMSVSAADIQAFEVSESDNLVRTAPSDRANSLNP